MDHSLHLTAAFAALEVIVVKYGLRTGLWRGRTMFRQWCGRLLLAVLCGCAPQPAAVSSAAPTPAIAPGAARIWVYRDYEPYETLAQPTVRFNGDAVGTSMPGGVFFRDVAPGNYRVTVDSTGSDVNQFIQIALAPEQTAYVKIQTAQGWESDLERTVNTFYTRLIPPQTAQQELARPAPRPLLTR